MRIRIRPGRWDNWRYYYDDDGDDEPTATESSDTSETSSDIATASSSSLSTNGPTASASASTGSETPSPTDDGDDDKFFSNKGAVAGVFSALGVFLVVLVAIIYLAWMRRRLRIRQTEAPQSVEPTEKPKQSGHSPHLARTHHPSHTPSPLTSQLQARDEDRSESAQEWWRLGRLRRGLAANLPLISLFRSFGAKSSQSTVLPGQNNPNDSIQFHMGLGLGYAPTREDDTARTPSLPATERRHRTPVPVQ